GGAGVRTALCGMVLQRHAPAKIAPARDPYRMIVRHHCPLAAGEELALGCSILLLRDKATSNLRRCSAEAEPVLAHVERLATNYADASVPTDELKDLRYRLLQLTQTASGLEMFAFKLGRANAGG